MILFYNLINILPIQGYSYHKGVLYCITILFYDLINILHIQGYSYHRGVLYYIILYEMNGLIVKFDNHTIHNNPNTKWVRFCGTPNNSMNNLRIQ